MPEQQSQNIDLSKITIDSYYDHDVVDLAKEGCPGYRMTKDGRVWSDKTYNGRSGSWVKPTHPDYPACYNLKCGAKKVKVINADAIVSKYFITPTMLSMPEHFKPIPTSPTIIVSDSGVVFDSEIGRFKHPSMGGKYLHITDKTGKYHNVHRLVATLFIPNPDPSTKTCVNHKNNYRRDNRAKNLEWCTPKENNDYSIAQGRHNHDGSTARSEAFMYPNRGGKKEKRKGITSMMKLVVIDD